jgi:hypothetical protein
MELPGWFLWIEETLGHYCWGLCGGLLLYFMLKWLRIGHYFGYRDRRKDAGPYIDDAAQKR